MLPFLIAATVVAAIAALTDYRTGHIPNWVTFPAIAGGVLGHGIRGGVEGGLMGGATEAALSLGGLALCSLVPAGMWWKGGMGGGDLKLFAAIGALAHPLLGIEAELYAFVVAAFVAPAQLAYRGRLLAVLKNSFALAFNPLRSKEAKRALPAEMMTWFRLGPAIFIGMLLTCIIHSYD